jgi:hypothetical protein
MKKASFVSEIIAHVAGDVMDTSPLSFDGFPGDRDRHAKALKPYERHIEGMLKEFPRKGVGESAEHWIRRVREGSPRHEDGRALSMAARLWAIIDRMDDEAELEDLQRKQQRKAEHDETLKALRHRAMPDEAEVAKLKATIDAAKQHEELLAGIYAAFMAHNDAQAARRKLASIFEGVSTARSSLMEFGEQVPATKVKPPKVTQAPVAAIEFAKQIQRVIALHPTR